MRWRGFYPAFPGVHLTHLDMGSAAGISAVILTAFVVAVSIFDIRERRIPNFLVFPATLIGLILNTWVHWSGGGRGLGFGLKGLAVGFGLLLLPYVVGGMKAGDVKFLAAIGAFLGAADVFRALLMTVMFYPVLAAVAVARERKLAVTWLRFRRVFWNFLGFFATGCKLYALRLEALDDPSVPSATTPFGVSIAAGTLIALYTDLLR